MTRWDWLVVALYAVFALWVGVRFARRAGENVESYFLSARTLPWWVAGTSMVATTFAADTPLVVTGWVRDHGIWKNWLWMCFAISTSLTVFLFARYWRRGGVMTTAELSELRYGGSSARVLRGLLGVVHALVTNTVVLCWVLLAARKILDVLFDLDPAWAVGIACALALSYSLLAGFWGVVVTDVLQFAMATFGAIALAAIAYVAIGGAAAISDAVSSGAIAPRVVAILPPAGGGTPFDATFWTAPVVAFAVFLGVQWWAKDGVDGGGVVVQRLAASRDERQGVLASLWYLVATFAIRPWPWIVVALASLLALPPAEVRAPVAGEVAAVSEELGRATVVAADGAEHDVRWEAESAWRPIARVAPGAEVTAGELLASTDSERAYVVMMVDYLPVGLLGLMVASLLAAFMSTIDTHVNLAASYFVNDVYRRFVRPEAGARHYVRAARIASVVVLAVGGSLALLQDSIGDLFVFFLAILGGVGPVYVLRWLWWRVRASTEIAAMITSIAAASLLAVFDQGWSLGPFSPGGALSQEGRLCLVVAASAAAAGLALFLAPRPDPRELVAFYRKVRPMGWWGPVLACCPDVRPPRELLPVALGVAGALAATYGLFLAVGWALLGRDAAAAGAGLAFAAGLAAVRAAYRRLEPAHEA